MSRCCADAVIASLAIAGVAKELGMLATTSPFFFVAGISSDITSKEKPRSGGKTQLVETRVLRTEIDVEGDAAPGAQRSSSSSTSAGTSTSWSSINSQTTVVQHNKSPPARTAERRTATTEQASTKSPGDGSTEALASNSKHRSSNAAVQQQARATKLSSSKKLLMSQKTKKSSTPSQAYAIKGTPGPGGWAPEASEGLGCGGPEGAEALVDKSQKLGVRCCGDSPTVIAAGGTIFTYFYTYANGNRLDCKTPAAGNCGPGQGISWDEAAAVCSSFESRRLCTVEEMKLLRPCGKGDVLEYLCHDSGGGCNSHCVWTADEPVTVSDTAANDTGDAVAEVDEASAVGAGTSTIVLVIGGVVLVLAAVGTAFALGIIGGDAAPGPTDAAPNAAAY